MFYHLFFVLFKFFFYREKFKRNVLVPSTDTKNINTNLFCKKSAFKIITKTRKSVFNFNEGQ